MNFKRSAVPFLAIMVLGLLSTLVLDLQVEKALIVEPGLKLNDPDVQLEEQYNYEDQLLTHQLILKD